MKPGRIQRFHNSVASWQPIGEPVCYPHEHIWGETVKLLTLFHPTTGQLRVKGVAHAPTRCYILGYSGN